MQGRARRGADARWRKESADGNRASNAAAVADNGVIGSGGRYLAAEDRAQRFRRYTGQAGRDWPQDLHFGCDRPAGWANATSFSTRDGDFVRPCAVVTTRWSDARAFATGDALRRFGTEIGGIGARKSRAGNGVFRPPGKSPEATPGLRVPPISRRN